jgi:hypothetical protein
MTGEFTPLFPTEKSKLAGITSGAAPGVFSQFAPVGGAEPGVVSTGTPPSTPHHTHRELNMEIKREGERISQIRVQCRCGELIEIDCEY